MDDDWFYDPENTLTNNEQDAFLWLFERERHFMVKEGYHNEIQKAAQRKKAVKIIAQRSGTESFDAFVPYLAMIYFDRYLSNNEVPMMRRTLEDDLDLLATCCLTIAWKMRNHAFSVTNFLIEKSLNMDTRKLMEMELEILTKLDWQMRSMTALGFIRYYITKFAHPLVYSPPEFVPRNFQEIIIQSQGDIKFTRFRQSLIAVSTLLTLCCVLYPKSYQFYKRNFESYNELKEEPLHECMMELEQLRVEKNIEAQRLNEVGRNLGPSSSQPSEPEGGSGGSLIQQRSGKAPVTEIEPVEKSRAEHVVMNFELNWYDPEAPDEPLIDTRPPPPASDEEETESEQAQKFNQCCGCSVA